MNILFVLWLALGLWLGQTTSSQGETLPTKTRDQNLVRMTPQTLSGMTVKTAEYWIFEGNIPFRYPDDVIRGFYPNQTPLKTLKCAEQGYDQLIAYLSANPEELRAAVAYGVTRTMVLVVSDYSLAAPDRVPRIPKLSHWGWGERDLSQGTWQWEITLARDGSCNLPRISGVRETLRKVFPL